MCYNLEFLVSSSVELDSVTCMSAGVVNELALFATAMDGDAGCYDLSMGLDMITATVFWLKFGVFDVFRDPWWNQGFSDGGVPWLVQGVFGIFPAEVHLEFLGSSKGVG